MSKVEEATNDFCTRCFKYGKCHKVQSECTMADSYEEGYEDGYRQAKRDLELTRNDVALILNTAEEFNRKNTDPISDKDYFSEILKHFKERKK